jgi:DnaJ-class molecular chaperone
MLIKSDCPKCKGTGIIDVALGTGPCMRCGGDGKQEFGDLISTDLEADVTKCLRRLKKIMDKLEVNDD